ncbi:MAG: hypothetical protein IPH45_18970 [Bacteroidales bacterium]|nr:hypothetical protein [Bacteroidales bacterium]
MKSSKDTLVSLMEEATVNTLHTIRKASFQSYDLFDALTNPLIDTLTKPFPLLRRIANQVNSRSPIDLHWLGMKKMVHTKTISDLLWYHSLKASFSKAESNNPENNSKAINQFFDKLVGLKIPDKIAWGLNFPYTNRFISAGVLTPNLYNTVNSGIAICHAYPFLDQERKAESRRLLQGILDFLENDLKFIREPDRGWYLYYPGQTYPTYNVNALALYFLVMVDRKMEMGNEDLRSKITAIIQLLTLEQNPDGSWPYARSDKGKWVDNFHTGFTLESLAYTSKSGIRSDALDLALKKGTEYYIRNLFTRDSYVTYFSNGSKYPIESQPYAQAIQTLANLGNWVSMKNDALLFDVIKIALSNLYNGKGAFYHKKNKYYTLKTPYFRWSCTTMILAFEYTIQYFSETRI